MISQLQEFVADRTQALNEQVSRLRKESVRSARAAAQGSAESLKALKSPVRTAARSGIKLSAVSQNAVQELIELQSDAVTAAIAELALRLERAARAASVGELVREQVDLLPATRSRLIGDAGRAVQIFATAGRQIRSVAAGAYTRATGAPEKATRSTRRSPKKASRRTTRSRRAAA